MLIVRVDIIKSVYVCVYIPDGGPYKDRKSDGWEAAAANAVEAAAQTLRNIKGFDVMRWTAKVEKNKIVEYRAVVKIAFIVERE